MIDRYINYIILVFLVFIVIQGFFDAPNGITPGEELYRLKIHDLNQEKNELLTENKKLKDELIHFEDEIIKNDSIIDNSSVEQLDSMFTDYFGRYNLLQ